jgi:hypothetical protein
LQAGIAVRPEDVNTTRGDSGDPVSTVNTSAAQPLCEACVKLLMAGQRG